MTKRLLQYFLHNCTHLKSENSDFCDTQLLGVQQLRILDFKLFGFG